MLLDLELASDWVTIGQLLGIIVTFLSGAGVGANLTGDLNRGQGGDLVAARVHYSLAFGVVGTVADLVVLPPALLLVLNGVHVVQHRGAVGCAVPELRIAAWILVMVIL